MEEGLDADDGHTDDEPGALHGSAGNDAVHARPFAETYRDMYPELTGYCGRLLADPESGADLAQKALVVTWGRWRSVSQPKAYAFKVATNLVNKEWARRTKDAQGREQLQVLSASSMGSAETAVWVWDLVQQLPKKWRTPTLLHYYADLDQSEVADVLRLPPGTLRRLLTEARDMLRRMIENES
jgi:RNA polymerase sigma-70 factor (ECF subfamily)